MLAAWISLSHFLCRRKPYVLALLAVFAALAFTPCFAFQRNGMPRTQRHESHQQIFQLEETWRTAMLKADVPALEAVMSDDYTAITASGALQSKEQSLDSLRSGAMRFTSLAIFDRRVRFYGSTALVTSRAVVSGTHSGVDISGSYRYTRVYVKNAQGQWKIVSFEASRIRPSGVSR
jgi:ketosteroid isomerase-like protein